MSPNKPYGQVRTPMSAHYVTGYLESPIRTNYNQVTKSVEIKDRYLYVEYVEQGSRIENFKEGMRWEDQREFEPPENIPLEGVWRLIRDLMPEVYVLLKHGARVIDRATMGEIAQEIVYAWYVLKQVGVEYTFNDYRERPWVESIRERRLAYSKELVRQAMLGEGVERADEVEPRIIENCIREAVHYRPIRKEWVREGVEKKVRAVRKQSRAEKRGEEGS